MRTLVTTLACLLIGTSLFGQAAGSPLKIARVAGDFYVYTTYSQYQGVRYPANALYLVTTEGVVLIDTPWDTTQFRPLLDSIRARHRKEVVLCLATHFHEDRTGGLEYYRQQGIKTYTTRQTDSLSRQRGMKRAEFLISRDTAFTVGQYTFRTYYPGPGHAPDNIVVWFEKERLLYGGCLIKSVEDRTLGNLSDASVTEYAASLKKVRNTFGQPKYIITGHNDWRNTGSLEHSIKLAGQLR
ncbi:MAG TPA: BlaB/IND/MUS family subclass B1 metallo-beta-lactamase [Chitinophagaceae bacterium]|jgi:metallo-beta-lactamase class B|nr:BlaB/IND/MUS family subclass B1 metallo-beta-lactamase [Chitinophagaceae bacterium]